MTTPDAPGPDTPGPRTHIGSVRDSAFAIGDNNTVTQHNAPVADPAVQELLAAVRRLHGDLRLFTASPETAALDAELVAADEEITTGGAPGAGRLVRILNALEAARAAIGTVASAVAVGESVAALLGR